MDVKSQNTNLVQFDRGSGYPDNINTIRQLEYPNLNGTTYLDYAGATPYARSVVDAYSTELKNNLFGNPHSFSSSSQFSSKEIDNVRLRLLQYLNADPNDFDLVFVANATAAIKLVGEAFRDDEDGFEYYYHLDSHTSLVGVRELASQGSRCVSTLDVERWLDNMKQVGSSKHTTQLFAYPGQSNMTGQRYSFDWCRSIRQSSKASGQQVYTLYDAAAILSTSPIDLSSLEDVPDFIALSFYKIFGFPDLGALVIRKRSADILRRRRYFGGGTVDLVSVQDSVWHAKKDKLHSCLEDGTLPFHTIIALKHALETQTRLFGSIENVAEHTQNLTSYLYNALYQLKHGNGRTVCRIYSANPMLPDSNVGPIITFNLIDSMGNPVSNLEVEKLAFVQRIQFRTGGLCNPGGTAHHLTLTSEELKKNYQHGQRCGGDVDIFDGKPTGTIRVSLGATSNLGDITRFINFLEEFFVDHSVPVLVDRGFNDPPITPKFLVDQICIFPIKSCAAFKVPPLIDWEVHPQGLRWDREWCLVHQGTNVALSQKQLPRMALLQPSIDLDERKLTISYPPGTIVGRNITISIDEHPEAEGLMTGCDRFKRQSSNVCGEAILVHLYTASTIATFFTEALGTPCTLARLYTDASSGQQQRHTSLRRTVRGNSPESSPERQTKTNTIKLSNESPILLVSKSSIAKLNEQIRSRTRVNVKANAIANANTNTKVKTDTGLEIVRKLPDTVVTADTFRANIVIAEIPNSIQQTSPYIEDHFQSIHIQGHSFDALGPCQRCQMICVDQTSGTRTPEPFSTLAKTRRKNGRVWFGMHMCLSPSSPSYGHESGQQQNNRKSFIRVGDIVEIEMRKERTVTEQV